MPPIPPPFIEPAAWPDDAIEVAVIVDAWGVKGGIRIKPYSADPKALFSSKRWWVQLPATMPGPDRISSQSGLMRVIQAREQSDTIVATCQDLTDRDMALSLKGAKIFVPRTSFPTAAADEYYWVDLIGMRVINRQEQDLGTVSDLIQTGPHAVLRVQAPTEILIPFVAAYIDDVSLPQRTICVDWEADWHATP
jgi:16S rRNA processing protein RimM